MSRLILIHCRSVYSDSLQLEQAQISQSYDVGQERLTLNFPTEVPAGSKAELRISFTGKLMGDMMGYYKSSWQENGNTKYYALTQFEVNGF